MTYLTRRLLFSSLAFDMRPLVRIVDVTNRSANVALETSHTIETSGLMQKIEALQKEAEKIIAGFVTELGVYQNATVEVSANESGKTYDSG